MRFYLVAVLFIGLCHLSHANTYYVDINGSDANGDGSSARPWRSLRHAVSRVPGNQGHTIKLSGGTFIEQGPINVPARVSIEGSGHSTIIKAASSFFFNPGSPGYTTDKYLIRLTSPSPTDGSQSIKNLTVNGDGKRLHGGVFVQNRNNILVDGVKMENINFNGLWFWGVKNSRITNSHFYNTAWASTGWCVGAINLGDLDNVEIDNVFIDEGDAYGIKAIGPKPGRISNLRIHDTHITVNPFGVWHNGQAPNIAIELWGTPLINVDIYDNYIDNTVSLSWEFPESSAKTVRVHHNVFDMAGRSKGEGYSIELNIDYAEIDHNYFIRGTRGIANWSKLSKTDWNIHHNVFYGFEGVWPSEVVRSNSPVHNIKFFNNTVETIGTKTANVFGLFEGQSRNIQIKNNLFINSNTGYNFYPNVFIYLSPGAASISNLQVSHNVFHKLAVGNVPGSYSNNVTSDPLIVNSGNRPDPFYKPKNGSPLIDKGVDVGLPFSGSAPDIGAYEAGTATAPPPNKSPQVNISGPADNATFADGATVTITANAADADGNITKVEFYRGQTKLGEDNTAPYTYEWENAEAGTYAITAKAFDNDNASSTSPAITVKVVAANNTPPTVGLTAPSNNASFSQGTDITLRANASDVDGSIDRVEFYQGNTRIGEDGTAPFALNWSNAAPGKYNLTARAIDNRGASTTSAAISITVNAVVLEKPAIAITAPANNATFTEGQNVTITATASDPDGSVVKVEFFSGQTKLGEDNTAPFALAWSNLPVGSHTLTAKATDNDNLTAISSGVNINVGLGTNSLPAIVLTSPSNNASFAPGDINMTATASDPDGSIQKVEFYNGSTKVGEDTSAPYAFTWKNVSPGTYKLTAKAIDNRSGTSTSAARTVTVVQPNRNPVVQIVNPLNNSKHKAGEDIRIEATAADPDGTIAKVEFFNGSAKLGERQSAPYTFDWQSVGEGTYSIRVRATDNKGGTATASITIVVEEEIFVPVADAGDDQQITLPDSEATLSGTGQSDNGDISEFVWAQTDGPAPSTIAAGSNPGEVKVSGLVEGVYVFTLTVTDAKGATATDQVFIEVGYSIASLQLPKVFSPNGDGINDTWDWENPEVLSEFRLMIFNRFGQKVYESASYDQPWDGSYNGSPLQEDAYYYVISSNRGELTGAVRILR